MWGRRILYALALLGALMGQLLDVGYLFHYIFYLTLTFPLLALAVSLPAMLSCRGKVTVDASRVYRGQKVAWSLTLESRLPLPLSRVKGRVYERSRTTGRIRRYSFHLRGAVPAHPGETAPAGDGKSTPANRETWAADTAHCALMEYGIGRIWVCDCLGIFALPVRRSGNVTLLVCPVAEDLGPVEVPENMGNPRPAPLGRPTSGEDYELRAYRPGDSLRAVHWKQSAKRDELVTKELLEDRRAMPVLTFDHFGTPRQMDRVLDRLEGYARSFLEQTRPFQVRWVHPETLEVRCFSVENEGDYRRCLTAALTDPAPVTGRSVLSEGIAADQDTVLYHIHITGEEGRHDRKA